MAVTNNATLIEDHESTTFTTIGSGQGPAADSDFFFLGSTCSSRKQSGTSKAGFWFALTSTQDLSAAGTHVKLYMTSVTPSKWTDFWVRIGSSTTVFEEHNPGVAFYNNSTGGWTPVWVEVDAGADTGSPNFAAATHIAVLADMDSISSNLKNLNTDQAHAAVRPVLTWDGTGGDLDDFITTESTDGVGALAVNNGVYTGYGSVQIGSATSTTFDMEGKNITFPDATWLPTASTFMGLDFDLSHASTDINAKAGTVISGNPTGATARKPDIQVTGTAGVLDLSGRNFDGVREIQLTSGVTMIGAGVSNSGEFAQNGADISNTSVIDATADGVVVDDATSATGLSVINSAGYGIDLTSYTATTIELSNITSTGNTTADVVVDNAADVVINLVDGASVGTAANIGAGNVTIESLGTIIVRVFNPAGTVITDGTTHVRVTAAAGGDLTEGDEILSAATDGSGEATDTASYTQPQPIEGWVRKSLAEPNYTEQPFSGTIQVGTSVTILVNMQSE